TQAMKVLIIAKCADGIAQAIVTAMASAMFKAGHTGRKVQFIVSNEDGFGRNLIKLRHGADRLAAAVHKGGGNQEAQIAALEVEPCGQTEKFIFRDQAGALAVRQLGYKIGAGIVTGS